MKMPSRKSIPLLLCGIVGLLWIALTLLALALSITGGDPLYTHVPGALVLPNLSLFGKIYLVSSVLLPFILIGAIATA
jgi:hypothetical protein